MIAANNGIFDFFSHRINIFRCALRFQEADNLFNCIVGHKGSVQTGNPATTGHVKHIALPQKLFGTLLAQDCAAVNF